MMGFGVALFLAIDLRLAEYRVRRDRHVRYLTLPSRAEGERLDLAVVVAMSSSFLSDLVCTARSL